MDEQQKKIEQVAQAVVEKLESPGSLRVWLITAVEHFKFIWKASEGSADYRHAVNEQVISLMRAGRHRNKKQDRPSNPVPLKAATDISQPPINAEFALCLFLREQEHDAFIGCLTERYGCMVEKFGKRRADIWYYAEVARSLSPLVRRFGAKAIKLAILGEWIRRIIQ